MKYLLEHESWKKGLELEEFMQFCKQALGYEQEPIVNFSDDLQKAQELGSMGYFDPATNEIWVFRGRRVRADWYRTLSHELVHHAQRELGASLDGSDGSDTENEANAKAGEILRAWGRKDPAIFERSDSSRFVKSLRLAKIGLADLENISARTWFPAKRWVTPDYRHQQERFNVSSLLTSEDFEKLDSFKRDGVIWYTDQTPGATEGSDDQFLKIVGPTSAVDQATIEINRMFDEAFHRISDNPKRDKLDTGGWNELIWHMSDPQLNSNWGKEQPAIYARWKKAIGL
jgi:hypothetical protein